MLVRGDGSHNLADSVQSYCTFLEVSLHQNELILDVLMKELGIVWLGTQALCFPDKLPDFLELHANN